MKRILLIVISLCFILQLKAQVSKEIMCTAGNLSTLLSETEKNTITDLRIDGTIDARDFKTIRDSLPLLTSLVFWNSEIVFYKGTNGTLDGDVEYPALTIPSKAFYNNHTLTEIEVSTGTKIIDEYAFYGCDALLNLDLKSNLEQIKSYAFANCITLETLIITNLKIIDLTNYVNVFENVPYDVTVTVFIDLTGSYSSENQWSRFSNYQADSDCEQKAQVYIQPTQNDLILEPGEQYVIQPYILNFNNLSSYNYDVIWYKDSLYNPNSVIGVPLDGLITYPFTVTFSNPGTYYYVVRTAWNPNAKTCSSVASITIEQAAGTALVSTPNTVLSIADTAVTDTISITSNTKWKVSSNASWLQISSVATIEGDGDIIFTAQKNTSFDSRTATLTIVGNGVADQEIVITQQAATISALEELASHTITIFPNPATSEIQVLHVQNAVIKIYNNSGELVLQKEIIGNDIIPIHSLAKGSYVVCISSKGVETTETLVVK